MNLIRELEELRSLSKFQELLAQPIKTVRNFNDNTVKAFVVTPKMTKNSIIFRGGYDKGYKIIIKNENYFCLYPNLFVCILIYSNKNIHFH